MAPKAKKLKSNHSNFLPDIILSSSQNSTSTSNLRNQLNQSLGLPSSAADLQPNSMIHKNAVDDKDLNESSLKRSRSRSPSCIIISSDDIIEEEIQSSSESELTNRLIVSNLIKGKQVEVKEEASPSSSATLTPTLNSNSKLKNQNDNSESTTTTIQQSQFNPFINRFQSSPSKPTKPIFSDALSSPSKPSLPPSSPGVKRTAQQILDNKLLAQAKLKARKEEKDKVTLLAKALAKERYAASQLSAFGITSSTTSTVYGNGTGLGVGAVVGGDGVIDGAWKPHESCSDEQMLVLERVRNGENIFFTGSAGVGKSFLMGEITRLLSHPKHFKNFQLTSTTGISALQIGGKTLHSFAGIGLGDQSVLALFDKISVSKDGLKNWKSIQTLIIDEVSMLSPTLFTKLSLLGKLLREKNAAFGGIQIIVSGDFFQLPPVPDKHPICSRCGETTFDKVKPEDSTLAYEELPIGIGQPYQILKCADARRNNEIEKGCGLQFRERKFAFETEAWAECRFKVMELTKVFRQSDPEYIDVLEKFRRGICDESSIKYIESCGSALDGESKIKPTCLYPIKDKVMQLNKTEFDKLQETTYSYEASDSSRGARGATDMIRRLKDVPPPPTIKLKKGTQVMLIANLEIARGLVNGSRGVIVDWKSASECPAEPNGSGKRGGYFGGEEWREKAADEFLNGQIESSQFFPEVYFASGVTKIIRPHSWVIDIDKNNSVARTALPLVQAWALTVHKSQGQSLDCINVDCDRTFEKGMAYVALSRCRTPAGMKVTGFQPKHIMAHPHVSIFYNRIAESKPFFDSPNLYVNPLLYIPESSPLLDRLHRYFNPIPAPLPVGSALPPKSRRLDILERPPKVEVENDNHLPVTSFKLLLKQAAEMFILEGGQDMNDFVNEARTSMVNATRLDEIDLFEDKGKGKENFKEEENLMEVDIKPLVVEVGVKLEVSEDGEDSAGTLSRSNSVTGLEVQTETKKSKKSRKRSKRVGA